jgi:hypothetical protein
MTVARTIIIFTITVSLVTFIAFFGRLPAFRYYILLKLAVPPLMCLGILP